MTPMIVIGFIAVFVSTFVICDANENLLQWENLKLPSEQTGTFQTEELKSNGNPTNRIQLNPFEYDYGQPFNRVETMPNTQGSKPKWPYKVNRRQRYWLLKNGPTRRVIENYFQSNKPASNFMGRKTNLENKNEPNLSNNHQDRQNKLNEILWDYFREFGARRIQNTPHLSASNRSKESHQNKWLRSSPKAKQIKNKSLDERNPARLQPIDNKASSNIQPFMFRNNNGLDVLNRNNLWLGKLNKPKLILVRSAGPDKSLIVNSKLLRNRRLVNGDDVTRNDRFLLLQKPSNLVTQYDIDNYDDLLTNFYSPLIKGKHKWASSRMKATWFMKKRWDQPSSLLSRFSRSSGSWPLVQEEFEATISPNDFLELIENKKTRNLAGRIHSTWLRRRLLQSIEENNALANLSNLMGNTRYRRSIKNKKEDIDNRLKSIWLVSLKNHRTAYYRSLPQPDATNSESTTAAVYLDENEELNQSKNYKKRSILKFLFGTRKPRPLLLMLRVNDSENNNTSKFVLRRAKTKPISKTRKTPLNQISRSDDKTIKVADSKLSNFPKTTTYKPVAIDAA